jgi:hypothetical protein
MNKKDIYQLIAFPVLSFVIIAVAAFFISNQYLKSYAEIQKKNQTSQQKFDQFVENVKNGKWQLTTEQWIEGMKLQRTEAKAEYDSIIPLIEFLKFIGWFGLVLAICNALVVLYLKDKILKRQNSFLREEQKK